MAEYISTFITGFEKVIGEKLNYFLNGVNILKIYDGLVHYAYNGDIQNIDKTFIFNNSFIVLKIFEGGSLDFPKMVSLVDKSKIVYPKSFGTFRVRFSKENQFSSVNKDISLIAEREIQRITKMEIDRVNPNNEFWYITRSEGIGFYCQLIKKRKHTEKNLNRGELRPEFAYLMCCCADLHEDESVCDPFAGYGSIPNQVINKFKFKKLFVSDINAEQVKYLNQNRLLSKNPKVIIYCADAIVLREIEPGTIDTIITDPPWGFFEKINNILEFYIKMLASLSRILKNDGKMILLSARKLEFETAVEHSKMKIIERVDTLVNGKKASVYILEAKNEKEIVY